MKTTVFVQASDGSFVQHGPVRRSESQAVSVARALVRRLGWVAVAAASCPPKSAPAAGAPSLALAGLSPVWKDPGLAARWAAKSAPAPVVAPPVVVAKKSRRAAAAV